MTSTQNGSVRLFRFAGIDVWLHWSWLLAALFLFQLRSRAYDSPVWVGIEIVALFGIVLLHEFGHALACRQTGGQANNIVLWPLGGIAFVSPPHRAGAQLWSIAAGPLVNVALIPIIYYAGRLLIMTDTFTGSGYGEFWRWMAFMKELNINLLIFNLLPIYPLDGGQILRCLLWFGVGDRKSLLWASALGIVGAIGLGAYALMIGQLWLALITGFLGMNSWRTFHAVRQAT